MERLYCDEILEGNNEYSKKVFLKLYNTEKEVKESFETKEHYVSWVIEFHDYIRDTLNFPNKLFGLFKIENKEEVNVVMFPKEPDNNYYKVYYDKEVMKPYILVDDDL